MYDTARIACLHLPCPGQMATGGNMAFSADPDETPIGPVCAFTLYDPKAADSSAALFPVTRFET